MTRRLGAVVLGTQAPVVFFGAVGARALADASGQGGAQVYLWAGTGLAVALVVAAGLLHRSYGVTLGWFLQVMTLLCGIVLPMMVAAGLVFGALWWVALVQGSRMDDLTESYLRGQVQT
ncbi:DUF4233 domain-containing protein [Austwickia chelonae]|uniref:DUF4233 domain-containing protein n=1 Tax=Austwickia chelonae TaxID=100225 RepID=UPI001F071767|nr:DUF4233 domain-containing protein [Austwickia chelonae]